MKHEFEKRANRIDEIIRTSKLDADRDLQDLLSYYAQLRKGGNGELKIRLVNGKLKIKGVTYIDPQ